MPAGRRVGPVEGVRVHRTTTLPDAHVLGQALPPRTTNDLWIEGERSLRFPGWALRHRRDEVAAQLRAALLAGGWRPTP